LKIHPLLVASMARTSGDRGGADLMVQTVLRLENQVLAVAALTPPMPTVRDKTARLASSLACDSCAVNPCFAAISSYYILSSEGVQQVKEQSSLI
jgi:hypothetical protein